MAAEQWCFLCEIQGSVEEDLLCQFLRAHGIEVSARGEALRHTHALIMDGLGKVKIFVAPEQLEKAEDLIEKVGSGALRLKEEEQLTAGYDDTSPD